MNSGDWPAKIPMAMKPFAAPMASISPGAVGRITAHFGRLGLINSHGTGNRRELARGERWQRLSEHGSEIGIGGTSISGIPARVYAEFRQVSETADLLGSRCLTARQSTESIEIHGRRAFGYKVRV